MRKHKVLVVSDAAYLDKCRMGTTGFGIVAGKVIEGLLDAGYVVSHFARGLKQDPKNPPSFMVYAPTAMDPNGHTYLGEVCTNEAPDVIFMIGDPGSIKDWRRNIEVRRVPNIVYTPTEGGPLLDPWASTLYEIIEKGGVVTTYTEFSAQVIKDALLRIDANYLYLQGKHTAIEILPHGIDHAPFEQYPGMSQTKMGLRYQIREQLGWKDKFVVLNVARNAGRKMLPRLMQAAKIAKQKIPNLLLYLHTVAFENYVLGGHNLKELAVAYGMEDYVMFHSEMRDGTRGITYEGLGQGQGHIGLIDLYNAADVFVSTSGAEGWNLPQCEAAACGLASIVPEHAGGWEVSKSFAMGVPVNVFNTEPSGLEFALVDPRLVADAIYMFSQYPTLQRTLSKKGLAAAASWKWAPTVNRFVELVGEIV